ncbi:catalase [Paracoccus cavernae]|uniref:catalase n=1 Tax=Paracoccus cavernae TaxID=1571207 RepID=A0ABT8D5D8_9RHOB|nr:catalase [Paracoccus cavernae]
MAKSNTHAEKNPASVPEQNGTNSDPISAPFVRETGNGGELHQVTDDKAVRLTTNHGVPIADNQNSLKAGTRGPTLLEDLVLREKIFHFDHERIPERIVHARGSVAHGTFTVNKAIPELTRAALFQKRATAAMCSFASRPWRAGLARSIRHATFAALR